MGADPAPVLQIDLISSVLGQVPLDGLMAVARRDNPKRAILVVSRLLGKHLDVSPTTAIAAGAALGQLVARALGSGRPAEAVDLLTKALLGGPAPALLPAAGDGPAAVVLAYAETATAIGHLVRRALGPGPLLHTTRALWGPGALLSFAEPHSHATEHLVFHDDPAILDVPVPVVLVDDELTTGRTVMNTIDAIQRIRPRDRYVLATYLDWRPAERREELRAFALGHGVQIDVVALASGTTSVIDPGPRNVPTRPGVVAAGATGRPFSAVTVPIGVRPTARRGWTELEQEIVEESALRAAVQLQRHRSGLRTLVLGTEELMYVPLLLAAHLEGDVQVRSTTRSPILLSEEPGYPVVDGVAYRATDGTAGLRYLYNLGLDEADDVFLCCEDRAAYGRSGLLTALTERHDRVHVVELVR